MRIRVAGISLDLDGSAWFANFVRAVPVYHAWSPPRGSGVVAKTRCGLALWNADENRLTMTGLPPRLAIKIGRPCATCWPELRAQPSLFTRRPGPGATRHEQEALHVD